MDNMEPHMIRIEYAEFDRLLKIAQACKTLCDSVSYRVEHGVQSEKAIIGMFTAYKDAHALYEDFMRNISDAAKYHPNQHLHTQKGYDRP